MILAFVGLLGVVAGFLTTVSGMGGGLMLVISLSALWGPHVALANPAPTLLVGHQIVQHLPQRELAIRRLGSGFWRGS